MLHFVELYSEEERASTKKARCRLAQRADIGGGRQLLTTVYRSQAFLALSARRLPP